MPLWPRPDLHAQLGSRIDRLVPGRLQHTNVQKRVPRAVCQGNETEAFFRIEPLDGGIDRRAAWSCALAWTSREWQLRPVIARRG